MGTNALEWVEEINKTLASMKARQLSQNQRFAVLGLLLTLDPSSPFYVDRRPARQAWAIVRPDGKTIHPESVRGSEHAAQWAIGEWPQMQLQGFTCRRVTIVAESKE